MHSMDKSQSSGEFYHHLYWAHVLIRHYLTTGRSMRLLKNMHLISICAYEPDFTVCAPLALLQKKWC